MSVVIKVVVLTLAMTMVGTQAAYSPTPLELSCTKTFPLDISADGLSERFGAHNVISDSINVGEGFYEPGTVLFPSDAHRRVEFLWKDAERRRFPRVALLSWSQSSWITPRGVRYGMSLKELERLNRRPFRLAGFAFDGSGTVTSWSGGALEKEQGDACLTRVRLSATVSNDEDRASFRQVIGDRIFSSGHPAMQTLNPTVNRIWLQYP